MNAIRAVNPSQRLRRGHVVPFLLILVPALGFVGLGILLLSPAWAAVPPPCLYDDFSGGQIDAAKWQDLEFVREIRAGKLVSVLRRATYPQDPGNYLQFANPGAIQSFRADVRLTAYTAPPGGEVRIRLRGNYYNDGAGGTGATGDVRAQLYLRGKASGVDIRYSVYKCTNADCTATPLDVVPATTVKAAALGEIHTLRIAWDGAVFTFTVDEEDRVVDPTDCTTYPGCQPIGKATPNVDEKNFSTLLHNVGAGGEGYVAADFDNVWVKLVGLPETLYDDFDGVAPFSGPRLNPKKWAGSPIEFVREVNGGRLLSKIATATNGAQERNYLSFANRNAVTTLRAAMAVTEFASVGGYVYTQLGDTFYNDGSSTGPSDATGDLVSRMTIWSVNGGPLEVRYIVERCADPACNSSSTRVGIPLGWVNVGEVHTLLLSWDGSVFTYGVDGDLRTYDPKPFAPVVKPPSGSAKHLRTKAAVTALEGYAYLATTFDNVYVNCDALNLPKLAPFLRETLPGDVVSAGVGLRGTGTGTINLTTIPPGATVKKAYLYWATLGTSGISTNPTLNGSAVSRTLIGQSDDPRWAVAQAFTYRADVTSRVTGNGSYIIYGLPSGPTPPGDLDDKDSEGASLVVLYSMPGAPSRTIIVNEGAVTLSGSRLQYYASPFIGFTATSPPTGAKVTFVVGDGQSWTPEYAGLGTTLLSTNAFSGSDGNYWDTRTYDVTSAMASGATTATAKLSTANDSLVWVASILSVPVVLPTVTVTATSGIATEGGGQGLFTFSRTGETASSPTVCFTVSGTATPGSDYKALPGCVTIPAGKSSATLSVTPLADKLHELNESVIVTLRAGTSYTVGYPNTARVVILNEDPFPRAR